MLIARNTAAPLLAAFLSLAALPASAADTLIGPISGSIGVITDYTFRGVSQTDEQPAVQIGLEYAREIGSVTPYVGIWGSNVNFVDADWEIDLSAGLRGAAMGATWDLGLVYYAYPAASSSLNYDFAEFVGKLGYDFGPAVATLGLAYSPEFFAKSGKGYYLQANLDVPLPWEVTATGHIGHQWIERNAVFGAPDYMDWSLGVAKDVMGVTLGLAYIDTDLSKSECFAGTSLCGARAIASATFKF